MATNTTNFSLSKPEYTDTADIAVINSNMDKVDASLNGLADAIAIVANNNTHAAITAGQYVYVHGHGSLAEGLYTAKSNIAANATLSTSNLQANGSGGLNALNSKIENVIKYQDTNFVYLNDLTWSQTAGGEYQAEIPLPTDVTISGTVIGIMIQRIQSIATDYYIMPFSNQGVPSVMANRNTFGSGSRMLFRILYIPS